LNGHKISTFTGNNNEIAINLYSGDQKIILCTFQQVLNGQTYNVNIGPRRLTNQSPRGGMIKILNMSISRMNGGITKITFDRGTNITLLLPFGLFFADLYM